jgi:putative hydrolase of the HAD superfamily
MQRIVVCFDLDDTLYKEIDYLASAYGEIATSVGHPEMVPQMVKWYQDGENVFQKLNEYLGADIPIADYLKKYRAHYPTISLTAGVEDTLNELKNRGVVLGIITDGRSVSQRNKIKALGLERWFDNENIIISEESGSEKTDERNFRFFQDKYPDSSFVYVGDNPEKDFVVPNRMGWQTVMIKDDGRNIHKQGAAPTEYLPQLTITNIDRLFHKITDG